MSAGGRITSEAGRRVNVPRPLTHSLDLGEEGLAMQATRTCSVEGCDKMHCARGLCKTHYETARKSGFVGRPVLRQRITQCSVEGCARTPNGRLCATHRSRLQRRGSFADPPTMTHEEAFWARVDRAGDCWIWTGARNENGYGRIRAAEYTHRYSWELHNGPIPEGAEIMHSCDNPPCVNPAHLRPGTHEENMAEASARGRMPTGANHWSRRG